MHQCGLNKRVILGQPFENYGISAFTVQLDLAIRAAHDGRHTLTRRVEFTNIKNLKFMISAVDINGNGVGTAGLGNKY